MKLKKHLNIISALALAPLCLLGLLGNYPKQMKASAIGDTYQEYSEEITFSHTEKDYTTEFVSTITIETVFNCDYKVNDNNIYIDNVTLEYTAYFYDDNRDYEISGVYNAPLNNDIYVKSVNDLNDLFFQVRTQYSDGDALNTFVLFLDFLGRQNATNGVYVFNNIDYVPSFNSSMDETKDTKLLTVIKAEVDGYNYGYNVGKTEGYAEGYSYAENMTLEHHGFEMLLNSIFSAPAYMFATAFNFEIFGINVKNILLLFLTIGLVIMAIGIFKSKE